MTNSLQVSAPLGARPIRVLVVDDSVVARGLMSRWIEVAGGFEIVGPVANGRAAVELARRVRPDIVLLDLDMPVMDGMEALPHILEAAPGVTVIVVSTLTQHNADASLRCLALGAADYQPKPGTQRELTTSLDFRTGTAGEARGLRGPASKGDESESLPPCRSRRAARRGRARVSFRARAPS